MSVEPASRNLGDVRMVHHRQCLTLGLEAGDDGFGVHAQLDDLECHASANGLSLFGHIDYAATAFSHPLKNLVAADFLPDGFVRLVLGKLQFSS